MWDIARDEQTHRCKGWTKNSVCEPHGNIPEVSGARTCSARPPSDTREPAAPGCCHGNFGTRGGLAGRSRLGAAGFLQSMLLLASESQVS